MPNDGATGRPTVKATGRSFAIAEAIKEADGGGVTELADAVGISKSTAHQHLKTLERLGYLRREGDEYKLGLGFLTLGGYAQRQRELARVAGDEVDELAAETGESVQVVVEENGIGVYLYQNRGRKAVRTDSHIGSQAHLHATAAGKAILAHLPAERVSEIVDRYGLPSRTVNTITDEEALHDELAAIRDRGVAFDDEERMQGIRCVAAPIARDGELLGALSVSGPTKRIDGEYFRHELPDLVTDTARIIEINATYA